MKEELNTTLEKGIYNLAEQLNISPEYQASFWKDMITWLRTYKDNEQTNRPFMEEELSKDSLFEIINRYCDLPSDPEQKYNLEIDISKLFSELLDIVINQGEDNFWNESVQKAIKLVYDGFLQDSDNRKPIANVKISVDDIKNADAGYSFNGLPWVRPNINFDNKEYEKVRGHDQVINVLNRDNKLQFTHTQRKEAAAELNKWLRLIMPQYGRRVEIEDLNRNFWVIAQVLAAISGFLFDEDSSLINVIKSLLEETLQLWENVMYLWMNFSVTTQKVNTGVRKIIFYINGDKHDIQHYKKYDDFDRDNISMDLFTIGRENNIIESYIEEYMQKYPEQNLVLLPIVRKNNYQLNYYSDEYYPAIYLIHRKDDAKSLSEQVITYPLYYNNEILRFSAKDGGILPDNFKDKIYATRLTEDGYQYCAPFSQLSEISINQKKSRYYCSLRVIPEINISLNNNRDDFEFDNKSIIKFKVYDSAANIIKGVSSYLYQYHSIPVYEDSFIKGFQLLLEKGQEPENLKNTSTVFLSPRGASIISSEQDINNVNTRMAFYKGENISWFDYPKQTFNAVITKKWNLEADYPIQFNASETFTVNGKSQTTTLISKTANNGVGDKDTFVVKNLPAYDKEGRVIEYDVNLSHTSDWAGPEWEWGSGGKVSIDYPNFTVINTWKGIELKADIQQITTTFEEKGATDTNSRNNALKKFLTYINSDTGKYEWINNTYLQKAIKEQPNNSGKLYCGRYFYHYNNIPSLETTPYLSFVLKINETNIQQWNFKYTVVDPGEVHHYDNSKFWDFPYVSSVYEMPTGKGTSKLCQTLALDRPGGGGNTEIPIFYSPLDEHKSSYAPRGNIHYVQTIKNGEKTSRVMKLEYSNNNFKLTNFLLVVADRSCAGTDSSIKGSVKDLYPYYYKCEITKPASTNEYGEITATVCYNNGKIGFNSYSSNQLKYKRSWLGTGINDDKNAEVKYWNYDTAGTHGGYGINHSIAYYDFIQEVGLSGFLNTKNPLISEKSLDFS